MQNVATVKRVLLASLHQGIGEVLPSRLGFYERWLNPSTPDASLGVASFMAMLTFLQQEGEAFDLISSRAGHHAALRAFQELPPFRRACLRMLPRRIRARRAVGLLTRILPSLYPETRVDVTRRRSTVFVGIDGSPFCAVRGSAASASCSFYVNTIAAFLELFNLRPSVRVRGCQSMGMRSCLLMVLPDQSRGAVAESAVLGLADDVMIPPSLELGGLAEMASPAVEPRAESRDAAHAVAAEPQASVEALFSETVVVVAAAVSETAPVSEAAPVPETEVVPETAPIPEAPPIVEVAPGHEAAPIPEAPPAHESVPEPAAAPIAVAAPSPEAAPTSGAKSKEAPNVEALWDAILSRRTRRPGSIRLNLDALFARSGVEDSEAPWHRLDES